MYNLRLNKHIEKDNEIQGPILKNNPDNFHPKNKTWISSPLSYKKDDFNVFTQQTEINQKPRYFNVLNKGLIFIIFSFFNCLFPLVLSVIASLGSFNSSQVVMGVSYASTFQLTFAQLGVTFATSLFFIFSFKNKDEHSNNFWRSFFLSIIVGIICCIVYVSSNFLYLYYSNNRPNTQWTIKYGMNFAWASILFILLSPIEAYLILNMLGRKKKWVVIVFIARSLLIILLSYLLSDVANIKAVGIGLGLSIGILLDFIFLLTYLFKTKSIEMIKHRVRILTNGFKTIKIILQESMAGIALSFAKGVMILFLGVALASEMKSYAPLSFQMARAIWFNVMYLIPWFGIGVSDAIKYCDLYGDNDYVSNKCRIQKYWILILLSLLIGAITCFPAYFLVKPLSELYTHNQHIDITEGLPTFHYKNIFGQEESKQLNSWPPLTLPEWKYGLDFSMQNFQEYRKLLEQDKDWVVFFKSNQHIFNKNIWLKPTFIVDLVTWYVKDYVANYTIDKNIIQALVLFRTNSDIITNNNLGAIKSPLMFLMFLKQGFDYNAKSIFYICIYGILCSGWSVLLPSTAVVQKRQIHPILLFGIYLFTVGCIIAWGAVFSISNVKNILGKNNPFMNMDAWTCPVAIAAGVIFSYLLIKWSIVSGRRWNK